MCLWFIENPWVFLWKKSLENGCPEDSRRDDPIYLRHTPGRAWRPAAQPLWPSCLQMTCEGRHRNIQYPSPTRKRMGCVCGLLRILGCTFGRWVWRMDAQRRRAGDDTSYQRHTPGRAWRPAAQPLWPSCLQMTCEGRRRSFQHPSPTRKRMGCICGLL